MSQLNKQTRPGEFYHLTANWLQSKKPRDIDFIPSILRHAPTWSRETRSGCAKMAAIVNEVYCTITIWDHFLEENFWPSFLLDRERKDNSPIIQFGTTLTQTPLTLNFKINEHFCKIPPHLDQSMLNKRTGAFYLSLKHETQLVLNNFEKRLLSVLRLLVLTRSYHNWSLLRSHASWDLRRWNSFRLQAFSEFSLKVLECKRKP